MKKFLVVSLACKHLLSFQIAKNRFDGELGVMLLKFDKDTLSFAIKPQKTKEEKSKSHEEEDLQADEENVENLEDRV